MLVVPTANILCLEFILFALSPILYNINDTASVNSIYSNVKIEKTPYKIK